MPVPDPVQATVVDDCKVKLTWPDKANDESGYFVIMIAPGGGKETVGKLKANTTEHTVEVLSSGKYQFQVGVYKKNKQGIPTDYNLSAYASVTVPATPACLTRANAYRIYFAVDSFTPSDPSYTQGFANVALGGPVFRIPNAQGQAIGFSLFSATKNTLAIWAPPDLQTTGSLTLQFSSSAVAGNKPPISLGGFRVTHTLTDLLKDDALQQVWEGKGQGFTLKYRIGARGFIPGVSDSPPQSKILPPPQNVHLTVKGNDHVVTWDYDAKLRNSNDLQGFNVYSGLVCPGPYASQSQGAPRVADARASSATFVGKKIPSGCACLYTVSAFGPDGESQTEWIDNLDACGVVTSPSEKVTVTFKDLTIAGQTLPQPRNATVHVWANFDYANTDDKVFLRSGTTSFGQIDFEANPGLQPLSPMTIDLEKNQSLQLGFYFSSICKSDDLVVKPPAGGWSTVNQDVTVQSANGGCKVTVHLGGGANALPGANVQPGGGQQGNPPGGQAQPNQPGGQAQPGNQNNPPAGQKCAGANGCTVIFVNKGSHPVTALKVSSDPNNPSKLQDVITRVDQIILPGGSLSVSGFKDASYLYTFTYGFLQNGQVVELLRGIPGQAFSGSAATVLIQDPPIQKLLSMYQNSAIWSTLAMDTSNNFYCQRFEFRQDGTFAFYHENQVIDTGKYGANVQYRSGAYSVEFSIQGTKYKFPNGMYVYAGPGAGALYVNTGDALDFFVQKSSCLSP